MTSRQRLRSPKLSTVALALAIVAGGCGRGLWGDPGLDQSESGSGRDAGAAGCTRDAGCSRSFELLTAYLPCSGTGGDGTCAVAGAAIASVTMAGSDGTVYDATAHVRGVVETKTYETPCPFGPPSASEAGLVAGGTPSDDARNAFRLTVSSPAQTYFLNAGSSTGLGTVAIDVEFSVRTSAGATITLEADPGSDVELENIGADGVPVSVAGAMIAQPYDGQFVEVEIGALTPEVLPIRPTGSAGSALLFNDGQTVRVADAQSLQPNDLTVEAWFMFEGFDPSHSSILGKPYGPGNKDSYTVWYQDVFNSGVSVFGPEDATSFAWTPTLGEWHHVAMTYDSSAGETVFYLDGTPSACLGSGPPVYDGHDLYLGADSDGGSVNGFWVGALDEVRIFSRARTAAEVWADMHVDQLGPMEGLVGEWTFDEGSGQTTADSSGNGNTGTLGLTLSSEPTDPSWIASTVPR